MKRTVSTALLPSALLAMATLLVAAPAAARPQSYAEMIRGALVPTPVGYAAMCNSDPQLCGAMAGVGVQAEPITEKQRMKLLRKVNRRVNSRVHQQYDVSEQWRPSGIGPGAVGDCEDLAIEKRMELISLGFPPKDLFFAIGYLGGEGLHAVLVAHTAKGDLVLDSRTPWTSEWSRTPYVWLVRQSDIDPTVWLSALPNGTPARG